MRFGNDLPASRPIRPGLEMTIDWTPLADLIETYDRFLVTTHVRPDGDALGSMLALAEVLREEGKEVRTVVASHVAPRYAFLYQDGTVEYFEPSDSLRNFAQVVIILDTSVWSQLGSFGTFLRTLSVPKLVIDHHMTQDELGAVRLVDTTAAATGQLMYEAFQALGVRVTPRLANCLFVALAWDTGWFRHSNATGPIFTLAAELISAGARPEVLYQQLYEQNTLAGLKLRGLVLDRLQVTNGGQVAHSEIRLEDYEATGATPMDSEELVNYPRSIKGVEVGLLFMEQPRGGIKVSFRARSRIDVARIAEMFGGGGHRLAAGATLTTTLDDARARVLEAVRHALASAG
jgi:bifunctional oligoribonuclease and PAP phosphatase NrnA